ncbi:hypothetical protein CH338_17680, partial [Rhodoplanes elegans]
MSSDRTAAVRDLLAFYLEAGVDALLAEEPRDRLRPEEAAAPAGVTAIATGTSPAPAEPRRPVGDPAIGRPTLRENGTAGR